MLVNQIWTNIAIFQRLVNEIPTLITRSHMCVNRYPALISVLVILLTLLGPGSFAFYVRGGGRFDPSTLATDNF